MAIKRIIKDSIYQTIRLTFLVAAKILFKYEVRGAENIPLTGGVIVAANHASYLDPPLIGMGIRRPIFYFAKEALFRGIFGAIIRIVNAIPVNRDKLDRKTLKRILEILKTGEMILMFPEGTRSRNGELQEGKTGIGLIAYHARVPVIPAYIEGSHAILPRDKKIICPNKCTVVFGPPIHLDQFFNEGRTRDLYSRISREIMRGIQKLRD